MEELRKRDQRISTGLLKEINQISLCIWHLIDLVELLNFTFAEHRDKEVTKHVLGLMHLWATFEDCLDPLEKQSQLDFS